MYRIRHFEFRYFGRSPSRWLDIRGPDLVGKHWVVCWYVILFARFMITIVSILQGARLVLLLLLANAAWGGPSCLLVMAVCKSQSYFSAVQMVYYVLCMQSTWCSRVVSHDEKWRETSHLPFEQQWIYHRKVYTWQEPVRTQIIVAKIT